MIFQCFLCDFVCTSDGFTWQQVLFWNQVGLDKNDIDEENPKILQTWTETTFEKDLQEYFGTSLWSF